MRTPTRPTPEPLRVNAFAVVVVGTVIWFCALAIVLAVGGHRDWVWVCLAGEGLGFVGLLLIRIQARAEVRRRRASR